MLPIDNPAAQSHTKVFLADVFVWCQVVAVISAMKMEMAVQSQVNGIVRATHVAVGDKIDPEDLLVEIEEEQWRKKPGY